MPELGLFPSPDGITISEDRDYPRWWVKFADGGSMSFGRSMFSTESGVRAFVAKMREENNHA